MEHVFGIRSRDTALLMAGNEISQILFIFAMPVIVKVKKRPFWTAIGLFCSALGLFLMAIPHWVKPVDEVSTLANCIPGIIFPTGTKDVFKTCKMHGPQAVMHSKLPRILQVAICAVKHQ